MFRKLIKEKVRRRECEMCTARGAARVERLWIEVGMVGCFPQFALIEEYYLACDEHERDMELAAELRCHRRYHGLPERLKV